MNSFDEWGCRATSKKQVPPGTRDARTGHYIRKPVRVQGQPANSSNGGCALTRAARAVVARIRGLRP